MAHDHHIFLAVRMRNLALALRRPSRVTGRAEPLDADGVAAILDSLANELDPETPEEEGTGEGAGTIELTDAGREYGRQLNA